MLTATDETKAEREPVRIRYSKGETGWAYELPNGHYQIDNLPLASHLNIGDIVKCREEPDELPIVTKLITRGLPCKSAVAYQTVEQFYKFIKVAKEAGCKCEGLVGPSAKGCSGDKNGIIIVAHKEDFDPFAEASKLGIKDSDTYHRKEKKRSRDNCSS
jgi:hypothetical protein